jgi:predicted nucleic acid-binding protein
MSSAEPEKALLDADVFISYIGGDRLLPHSERAVESILNRSLEASVSSIIYDDVVTALRSKEMPIPEVIEAVAAMASIPHGVIAVDAATTVNALRIYMTHGGSRRLHYFDSYHVATALRQSLPLITSDKYVITNQAELGIRVMDLRKY